MTLPLISLFIFLAFVLPAAVAQNFGRVPQDQIGSHSHSSGSDNEAAVSSSYHLQGQVEQTGPFHPPKVLRGYVTLSRSPTPTVLKALLPKLDLWQPTSP